MGTFPNVRGKFVVPGDIDIERSIGIISDRRKPTDVLSNNLCSMMHTVQRSFEAEMDRARLIKDELDMLEFAIVMFCIRDIGICREVVHRYLTSMREYLDYSLNQNEDIS